MTNDFLKTRFCPSPTGLMHLGNLRTGLFNVLLAKSLSAQGKACHFLLRIEDSDPVRSQHMFTESIKRDLRWLHCNWQEGPESEEPNGPYFQSKRHEIYEKYYQQLIEKKCAYWCYCTEAELSIVRKSQINAHQPPRYAGTCRHLTTEQMEAKKAKGLVPALRFRIPDGESIQFDDFIQGSKNFSTDDIGDFIIKKADGSSSFMFCNALDDSLMGVTHVMRGEDHLTNTPRQLLILKALGLREATYGHMPLILGFDGKPLSKRNGSQSIEDLRKQGFFPLAINNYLSRLGHHFDSNQLLSLDDLGKYFLISQINRSPAHFDEVQLKHWQKETILHLSNDEFWQWIEPHVSTLVKKEEAQLFSDCVKQNVVFPKDAVDWAEQLLTDRFILDEEAQAIIQQAGQDVLKALENAIRQYGDDYQAVQNEFKNATGLKGKPLFMTIRAVISGRCYGPELAKIFPLVGKALLLNRVETVIQRMMGKPE